MCIIVCKFSSLVVSFFEEGSLGKRPVLLYSSNYLWDKHISTHPLKRTLRREGYLLGEFQLFISARVASDATGPFTDVGHSQDALELRKKYLIGVVGSKSTADEACLRR